MACVVVVYRTNHVLWLSLVGDGLRVARMSEGRNDGCIPGVAGVYPVLLGGGVPFASLL